MVGFQKKSQYEISVVTLLPSERLIQLQTEVNRFLIVFYCEILR